MTPDRWKKLIRHVREKVEDHYWSCDGLYQQRTQRFIIQFGECECLENVVLTVMEAPQEKKLV